MEAEPEIRDMIGKYPIIKLSLKSARQPDFRIAFLKLRDEIIGEILRHSYLKESDNLLSEEKEMITALARGIADENLLGEDKLKEEVGRYATAFKTFSTCLKKHYGENVIILLDEYDVPLENAYYNGFYREMVDFIRSLFESALKTNDALEFAVVTGCLRISKESIFTGLNHLEISSIRNNGFEEAFGFTEAETEQMLRDYGIEEKSPRQKTGMTVICSGRRRFITHGALSNMCPVS